MAGGRGRDRGIHRRRGLARQWSRGARQHEPLTGCPRAADGAQNAARIVACVNACEGIDDPAAVREAIDLLERVYLANKCPGIVNGEAALCPAYADRAADLLTKLGRKP